MTVYNAAAEVRYLKVFDLDAPPSVGTTPASFELPIPPGGAGNPFADLAGIIFTTGIQIAVTAAEGLTDDTADGLADADLVGRIDYAEPDA